MLLPVPVLDDTGVSNNNIDCNKCESSYRTNRNIGMNMVMKTKVPNSIVTNTRRCRCDCGGVCDGSSPDDGTGTP